MSVTTKKKRKSKIKKVESAKVDSSIDKETRQLLISQALIGHKKFEEAKNILEPILRQHQPGGDVTDNLQKALFLYAETQRLTGHHVDAYNNYCLVSEFSKELAELCLPSVFNCFAHIKEFPNSEFLEQHLISFLDAPNTDNKIVDKLTVSSLKQHYQFHNPEFKIELSDISEHDLLIAALPKLFLCNPEVELFLIDIRRFLLSTVMEQGLNKKLVALVKALGQHGFHNEYVSYISNEETKYIEAMRLMLESQLNQNSSLEPVTHLILTLTMYLPLNELSHQKLFTSLSLAEWPEILRDAAQTMIIDRQTELTLSHNLSTLSDIENTVSQKVRQQYEGNPYPRWATIPMWSNKFSYLSAYPHLQSSLHDKQSFEGPIECLVAGGGTGKHPITIAEGFSNIQVTSMDLSRASLAYGMRIATILGTENIKFIQGDILDVHLLKQKFDVIECMGVLHHMEQPLEGLKALLKQLRPKGILKLGLYSKIARSDIIKVRAANKNISMEPSLNNIREFRFGLLNDPNSILRAWPDFYSLSECRDLLFHEQEHQFTIQEIQAFLNDHQLRFLGFSPLNPPIKNRFSELFPDDPDMTDLNNWHQFEEKNPHVFSGMYQFHCQLDS